MNILNKIDALRKERGWSVNNLAMEAMLTQSTLNNLYTRKTEPKLSTLRAICSAFGISLAEFFAEEEKENNEKRSDMEQELGGKNRRTFGRTAEGSARSRADDVKNKKPKNAPACKIAGRARLFIQTKFISALPRRGGKA